MVHTNIDSIESDGSDAITKGDFKFTELMDNGVRAGLNQAVGSFPANILATWNNNAQAYAEGLDYGIPVVVSSNPNKLGFADNLALSATFDTELVSEVYQSSAELYRAAGVSVLLGPQVDLSTEPRWNRISGTFGEDPALSSDLTNAAISALQSTYAEDGTDLGWGEDSVIAMMKHWPGDGAGESGRESHSESGKYTVYPGDGFETALIPFVDAGLNLDSLTGSAAAAMTSYSIAYSDSNEYGELVGSAYSEYKIDLLRGTYGFDGLICCDWGALDQRGWGFDENVSEAEHVALMILAGVDQIGDVSSADFDGAYELLKEELGEEAALTRIQDSARRILKASFQANLFENGYITVKDTVELYDSDAVNDLAEKSQVESIVMLKNSDSTIQATSGDEKPTVYIPMSYTEPQGSRTGIIPGYWSLPISEEAANEYFNVVTDTLGEPTGEPDADGQPTYTSKDIIRASAEELAGCDYALVFVKNPINEGDEGNGYGHDKETGEYFPISLQYGAYTADSESVRKESISGNMVAGQAENVYGTFTTLEKENRSYYGAAARIVNGYELEKIQHAAANMPENAKTIVCVNTDRPMIFSEFEDQVDVILVGFGIGNEAFLEIVTGQTEPSGLLPLQMPANMETVEAQYEDVPRDMECYVDSEGNTYDFAFGLNWSGVINDERVAAYSAAPLTAPETQPVS